MVKIVIALVALCCVGINGLSLVQTRPAVETAVVPEISLLPAIIDTEVEAEADVPAASVLPSEIQNIGDLVRPLPAEIESEAQCAEEPNSQIEIVEIPEVEVAVPEVEVITPELEIEAEAEACAESEIVAGDLTRPLPVPESEVEVAVPEVEVIVPEVEVVGGAPAASALPAPETSEVNIADLVNLLPAQLF